MSTALPNCRIDWRPSRWLCAALCVLGLLAAASLLRCELPAWCRFPLALLALAQGLRLARREWRQPPRALEFGGEGVRLMQEGQPATTLQSPRLRLRGWMASLEGRGEDGRRHVLLWAGDTLDAAGRRKLRLHLGGLDPA